MKTALLRLTAIILAVTALCSCHRDTPPRDRGPLPVHPGGDGQDPGGGDRPGLGDTPSPFDRELADPVWRFTGRTVSLRYDRGGILFATGPDGTLRITDLDGATEVTVTLGPPAPDSVCPATIGINGRPLALTDVRLRSRSDRAAWYEVIDADSSRHVLVTPPLTIANG